MRTATITHSVDVDRAVALAYYARHRAALFPILAGQKNPTGIIKSFAHDWSTDPAQWAAWRAAHPYCNFGLVAGPSGLIVTDTDVQGGQEAAWTERCELFAKWDMSSDAIKTPHVRSARGGWHDLFAVPEGVDASTLRQPDAIRKLINVRAGNGYVVAAGSHFVSDGQVLPYVLLSDAPPHPAPAALLAHCTRAVRTAPATAPGGRDPVQVAALVDWLNERDAFADYDSWFKLGMALKLEFGEAGRALWARSHNDTVTADVERTKWASFSTTHDADSVTLATFIDQAAKAGWRGSAGKTADAMFAH